jgi:hypothetical protein
MTLNVTQALSDIDKYQRALGAGKELDADRKAPIVPPEPDVNTVFPHPGPVIPQVNPTAAPDEKKRQEEAYKTYKDDVKLHTDTQRLYDGKLSNYQTAKERLAVFNSEHDRRIAEFASFFPEYKFQELEENTLFSNERTLYNAYIGMADIMRCSQNTGILITLMFSFETLTWYHNKIYRYPNSPCHQPVPVNLDPQGLETQIKSLDRS